MDERLFALDLCSPQGRLLVSTDRFPESLACADALLRGGGADSRMGLSSGTVHVGVQDILGPPAPAPVVAPITEPAAARRAALAASDVNAPAAVSSAPVLVARMVQLHDLSFIERRSQDTRNYLIGPIAVPGLVIAFITVVVAQLSWRGWSTAPVR